MNINITAYCNLKCPYCFAVDLWQAAVRKPSERQISLADLGRVIRFMKRSRNRSFRMLGGEPTLHSEFRAVFNAVVKNGFRVTLFSNGIIDPELTEFLSGQKGLEMVVVNAQHPGVYTAEQERRFIYTLRRLGPRISLGTVIYRPKFDLSFLIPLIDRFALSREVKISIAAPCLKRKNVSLPLDDHPQVIESLVRQSRLFRSRKIRWYPDTTFMWCLFSRQQLAELKANTGFVPRNLCTPVLEVAPNLSVFRCYGTASLSDPRLKITDFRSEKEAWLYFAGKEKAFKQMGVFQECRSCSLRGEKCGAGCMVHIIQSFSLAKERLYA